MFEIQKNIPIPLRQGGRSLGYSETFRAMSVGDSFECDYTAGRRQGMYSVAKRQGIKIKIYRTGDTMRVWRIQ